MTPAAQGAGRWWWGACVPGMPQEEAPPCEHRLLQFAAGLPRMCCAPVLCPPPHTHVRPLPFPTVPDCGSNPNTTKIVVNVRADFTGHPSISPRVLMNNAKWNLCLEDEARRKRGEADLCW